jgi:glycosyltransferase involved in cell wall biosynthesis
MIDSFEQGGPNVWLQLTKLLHQRASLYLRPAAYPFPLKQEVADLQLGDVPSFPLNSFYDLNALGQLRRFVRFLRDARVDILHTHDFYTNVFGMTAGALARVPVRIASRRETSGMRSAAQLKAQRFAYRRAHQVLANSAAVQAQLQSEGIAGDKITVIYNGLEIDRVRHAAPVPKAEALRCLGLNAELNERRIVTIVANMRLPVKDHAMLLRMARRVSDSIPAAAFVLAGEGELMPSIIKQADDAGLSANTFFTGACDKLAELLAVSDVCVLTSKSEGFSNSILEYMAAARPVVVTNVGGAGEAVMEGETGYLVESGDDATMAQKVLLLLNDAEKARAMGERGYQLVKEKFSRAAQLNHTEDLYDRLLRSGKEK